MVKKVLLLAVLALALPLAAFASGSSVDFTNTRGTLTGSSAGLSLSGSDLTVVDGLNGGGRITGPNLGSVTFTTGAFQTGDIKTGGTLVGGGSFTITGNGVNGVPSGVIFSGTFSSAQWVMMTDANGNHNYTLLATLAGNLGSGFSTTGFTSQLTVVVDTHKGFFNGSVGLSSGDTSIVVVPEPGTLSLLGTGLIGLAGVLRRKLNLV